MSSKARSSTARGEQDDNANFLVAGSVEFFWGGKPVKVVDARDKAATQVLDSSGAKRFTVVAKTPATILRLSRSQLDQKLRSTAMSSKLSGLKRTDDNDTRWPAWKMRLIRSPLFKVLPISQLKEVLNRMERVALEGDDIVVHQGETGDYYYVVDEGVCTVSREVLGSPVKIHVADLATGEAFGEEALVTNSPRNATVAAQGSCQLLRLDRQTFLDLVHKPLVTEVSSPAADAMIEQGAVWLDVRPPDRFAASSFTDAINLPLTLLRVDCARLSNKYRYIVCAQTRGAAQVGTLLLRQRGFDAVCLLESVEQIMALARDEVHDAATDTVVPIRSGEDAAPVESDSPTATRFESQDTAPVETTQPVDITTTVTEIDSSKPIARDLYDETLVGQSLADLIDQMHMRQSELDAKVATTRAQTPAVKEVVDLSEFTDQVDSVSVGIKDARGPVDIGPDVRLVPTLTPITQPTGPTDALSALSTAFERGLRDYLATQLQAARAAVQKDVASHITQVKQAAVKEVRRQAEAFRDQYRQEQVAKQTRIKSDYDKLKRLAHQISRQKAELQRARRELETKLEVTSQLQTEIDAVRNAITVNLGNFDSLKDELSESL